MTSRRKHAFQSTCDGINENRKGVITEGTYLCDLSVFEKDILPTLGDMPIDQIKGKDVLSSAKKLKGVVH